MQEWNLDVIIFHEQNTARKCLKVAAKVKFANTVIC
jgi:hypothetical protein